MKTIRISEDVWKYMEEHGRFGESAADVLRRGLGIPPAPDSTSRRLENSTLEAEPHATVRLYRKVGDGFLDLTFESGDNRRWPLPAPDDKPAIRQVLYAAMDWAKERDASLGQLNAVRKALTDHGFHLRK